MPITLTYYGHAFLHLRIDDTQIAIDPFFAPNNPACPVLRAEVTAEYILVTHGHGDHSAHAPELAKAHNATVIANGEVSKWLRNQGVEKVHAQHIGGGYRHPFGYVKLTQAWHGSQLPDGSSGGTPAGFLIETGGQRIYIAGDTGLFGDMALIGEGGLDLAVLPIGDNYTMGPSDALRAVTLLQPRQVLPYHYNTWPIIAQDGQRWAAGVRALGLDTEPVILQPGETLTL